MAELSSHYVHKLHAKLFLFSDYIDSLTSRYIRVWQSLKILLTELLYTAHMRTNADLWVFLIYQMAILQQLHGTVVEKLISEKSETLSLLW